MRFFFLVPLALSPLVLAACGGKELTASAGDGGVESSPNDAPSEVSTGPDTSPASPCPPAPPTAGQACSPVGLYCEYGDSEPNPRCNDLWQCAASGWIEQSSRGECPPPGLACPDSYADVPVTESCSGMDQLCVYPTGTCVCSPDPGGLPTAGGPAWVCTPLGPECPDPIPQLGTSCTSPGLECDYGQCSGGVGLACTDGYWAIAMTVCPA
jgi:hypothetical protein